LALTAAALAQQHSIVPVVLVDGYDFLNGCRVRRDATTNFGQLAQMLAQDSGKQPLYYDYCAYNHGLENFGTSNHPATVPSASNLGPSIAQAAASSKSGQVDVIAYSAGGLFVREYLAQVAPQNCCGSLNTSNLSAFAFDFRIRKLVLIGSPNFGIAGWRRDWAASQPTAGGAAKRKSLLVRGGGAERSAARPTVQ
jgi:hypothetical protein